LFFSGIVTTGVYCRPVCPVPRPAKRENIRFLPSAAAAEAAGFRPCRRCHPERAASIGAWSGVPPVVSRALNLIGEGAVDGDGGVDLLARRVGIGSRQLRRLFETHLGATPLAIAKARRVHFARRLLDDIEQARALGDRERAAQADAERDFLVRELSRAVGLGGRDRRAASASERARVGVTRALRKAIARIGEHHPQLGEHLNRAIRTGTYCAYRPDPRAAARWRFDIAQRRARSDPAW
jgi:methylphosphotriester-DNA--protein-cysteine methyltransferase